MRFAAVCLLACILSTAGHSQYYSTGQDPASIQWRQIKQDHFRLIYPSLFEKKAQYLANILDMVSRNETHTLAAKVPRIPVLVHSQSSASNGITVWAPKRIELYPCAPQQTYAEEWLEQLVIHEYRHAVQLSKINQGFSKALSLVFGEQITGGILGLYVPPWFLEGDATVTETSMSRTGRGRSALFECTLRAQLAEKGIYSYDKATMGSYKTYTPDAYSLGYYVVGQARRKYGPDLWNMAMNRVAKYPFMVVPFNSGIRKVTGLWKTRLYEQSLSALDSVWKKQLRETPLTTMRPITRRDPGNHTTYNHPLLLNDSTILADKSCMDDIDRFVLIDRKTGRERKLLTPGYHISATTSVGGDYLVWSETEQDIRWSNRDYAEIRTYNFKTGKTRELTHESRYFAPIISADGAGVAAVYVSPENECSIDLLSVPSGCLIKRFPIPGHGQAITPNWSPDSKQIIFTLLTEKGETIASMDTATGRVRCLMPWSFNEINGPAYLYSHFIIYSTDDSDVENIYAMDTLTKAAFRITSARFAAFDPDFTPDKKKMIYSDYTSDGLMVVETDLDPSRWTPVTHADNHPVGLADALTRQETANIQDSVRLRNIFKMNTAGTCDLSKDTIIGKIFETRRYSRFLNLLNPHSWAPLSFDVNNLAVMPGVMLLSQNVLSTMFAAAGWEYDVNEQTGKFYASLSYKGWYPEFTLRFDIGNRAAFAVNKGGSGKSRFTWQETNLKAFMSIPFNFSHGKYSRYLQPSVGFTLTGVRHNSSTPEKFTSGNIQSMDYSISASQYLHRNQKDVYPRWGQDCNITYRNTPFGGSDPGSVFGAATNLYFPGVIRHQGFRLYAGYQHRVENHVPVYSFADIIRYPRGYTDASDLDLCSASIDYKFPVIYPDLSAGSAIYLKRISVNLFYDWANGNNQGYVNTYQSTGAELTFDFHLLRFLAPVTMGVRSIYYPSTGSNRFEFLYAISY